MPCSRGDGPSLVDRGTSFGMLRQKRSHITVVRSVAMKPTRVGTLIGPERESQSRD
jgi:hypothetical protein